MRRWGVHPSDDTHLAGEDRRLAKDGKLYTFNEFVEYYGTTWGPQKWNSADIHRAGEYRGATNQASSSAAASVPGGVSQPAAAPEQDQLDEEMPSAAVGAFC